MGSVGVLHSVVLHRRSTAMKSVTVRSWSLSCFYSMNCFPQRIFQIVPCNQVSSTASSLKHVQAWSLFRRSDSGARTLEHDDVGYIRSTLGVSKGIAPNSTREISKFCYIFSLLLSSANYFPRFDRPQYIANTNLIAPYSHESVSIFFLRQSYLKMRK